MTTQTATAVLTRPSTSSGGGNGDLKVHIIRKRPQDIGAPGLITEAMVEGFEIEALCGYKWIPCHDVTDLPVCEACKQALANLK